jgi:hypothetical protein
LQIEYSRVKLSVVSQVHPQQMSLLVGRTWWEKTQMYKAAMGDISLIIITKGGS